MVHSFKDKIRVTQRKLRSKLSFDYQIKAAEKIIEKIQKLEKYHSAQHIALYKAIPGEINLEKLWRIALLEKKMCSFPIINSENKLSFLPTTLSTAFINNKYNILEPRGDDAHLISVEDLDIIFMPLLAFDDQCTRLGMGGGYYDRTLAEKKTSFINWYCL